MFEKQPETFACVGGGGNTKLNVNIFIDRPVSLGYGFPPLEPDLRNKTSVVQRLV